MDSHHPQKPRPAGTNGRRWVGRRRACGQGVCFPKEKMKVCCLQKLNTAGTDGCHTFAKNTWLSVPQEFCQKEGIESCQSPNLQGSGPKRGGHGEKANSTKGKKTRAGSTSQPSQPCVANLLPSVMGSACDADMPQLLFLPRLPISCAWEWEKN